MPEIKFIMSNFYASEKSKSIILKFFISNENRGFSKKNYTLNKNILEPGEIYSYFFSVFKSIIYGNETRFCKWSSGFERRRAYERKTGTGRKTLFCALIDSLLGIEINYVQYRSRTYLTKVVRVSCKHYAVYL